MDALRQTDETAVLLRYAPGQEVEALLPGSLGLGDSFTLYGRHWEVVREIPPPRTKLHKPPMLLCMKSDSVTET